MYRIQNVCVNAIALCNLCNKLICSACVFTAGNEAIYDNHFCGSNTDNIQIEIDRYSVTTYFSFFSILFHAIFPFFSFTFHHL